MGEEQAEPAVEVEPFISEVYDPTRLPPLEQLLRAFPTAEVVGVREKPWEVYHWEDVFEQGRLLPQEGVYVVMLGEGKVVLYIGQSRCMLDRLLEHREWLRDRGNYWTGKTKSWGSPLQVALRGSLYPAERLSAEIQLIVRLEPILNKMPGGFSKEKLRKFELGTLPFSPEKPLWMSDD